MKNCNSESNNNKNDNKSDKIQQLREIINDTEYDEEDKESIINFVTKPSTWGGGKGLDRGDYWVSPTYEPFGIKQSLSAVEKFVLCLLEEDSSELYDETFAQLKLIIRDYNNSSSKVSIENESFKGAKNIIYYGAPGTGKSYGIQNFIREKIPEYSAQKGHPDVFRVTLHPEYTYSDFVGQLLPVTGEDDKVTYKFVSGIFTSTLEHALKNNQNPVYLVLEEMSRANVAAVFGDIFQLLDRDEDGRSEYTINNSIIAKAVFGSTSENYDNISIFLPSNLFILGTVNTSDQNVFAMDTAFKRRFIWRYVTTKVDDLEFLKKNNPTLMLESDVKVDWYHFYTTLNTFITDKNLLGLSEDKQIGPYFIKFQDNVDPQKLVRDKLLQYLWDDVHTVAYSMNSRKLLFNTEISSFADLYDSFNKGENIFSDDFISLLNELK